MASKITAYKFVNPGLSPKGSPSVLAANKTTLAVNRLGVTVESVSKTIADIATVSVLKGKLEEKQLINERRQKRLEKDQEAEAAKEYTQKDKKKDENTLKGGAKKVGKGALGWLENFLGPLGSFLMNVGGFALANETLKQLGDPENREKIKTFFERADFVFNKLKEFAESIGAAIGEGLDFIFGKETTIEERLNAFGKIAMAIGGIAGMLAAASGLRDLLDAGDALPDGPDGTRRPSDPDAPEARPRKPTAANPSGADPNTPGPRGRKTVAEIADEFGQAASKKYDDILKKYGDDAARAFALELSNTGGDAAKALTRWKRLGLQPIDPPKPGMLRRFWEGTLDLGGKGLNLVKGLGQGALDLIKRGIKKIPPLPNPLEVSQKVLSKLSSAGKAVWSNTVAAGQAIGNTASKWGNNVKNFAAKSVDNLSSGAKNFFMDQIMSRLKPLIDPLMEFASGAGKKVMEFLMKIPGFDQVGKFLKSKGIESIATAGSKLGKRAAAILPVIGGIVNLLFAYDRFANGDTIGGILESISGILDIGGLATAGASSVASMFLDGYLFARDFIPQLSEAEDSLISALGLGPFKLKMDGFFSQLPNLSELFGGFMKMVGMGGEDRNEGEQPTTPQGMFLGGVVKSIGKAVGSVGKAIGSVVSNPIVQTAASFIPGAAPIMAGINMGMGLLSGNPMQMLSSAAGMIPGLGSAIGGILNSPLGQIGQSFLSGGLSGAIQTGLGYAGSALGLPSGLVGIAKAALTGGDMYEGIRETAVQAGVDPKIIGVADAGKTALSKGGLSERYVLQEAIEFLPVPIIMKELQLVPQAVPINSTPAQAAPSGPSSLTQRMQ